MVQDHIYTKLIYVSTYLVESMQNQSKDNLRFVQDN